MDKGTVLPITPDMPPPDTEEYQEEQEKARKIFEAIEKKHPELAPYFTIAPPAADGLPMTPPSADYPSPTNIPSPDYPPPPNLRMNYPYSIIGNTRQNAMPITPPDSPDFPPTDYAGPRTPDYPPPLRGGADAFQLGGNVYYRKSDKLGLEPDHVWRIINKGRNFMTIESMADLDRNNKIQIVEPDELILPDQYDALASRYLPQNNVEPHMSHPDQSVSGIPVGQSPNINIKIVNGDDKSMAGDVANNPPHMGGGEMPQSEVTFSNFHKSGGNKQNAENSNDTPASSPAKEETILGGLKDFSKLLIRKIT
jgi:hypothetical protein